MEKKVKILLVSPYSKAKVGGIGTWTKLVLDYSKTNDDVELLFQNTVHSLPKRWSLNSSFAHVIIGSIDSLLILIQLFCNLCLKKPDIVHYTSSAASALYKDRIAVFITTKIFKKKFVIHWRFGRIPTIFMDKGKEFKNFMKVLKLVSLSIVLDSVSYNVIKSSGFKVELIPNPISKKIQNVAERLNVSNTQSMRAKGTVLFVGHMLEAKGIFELVKACAKCPQVNKLVMVGPFFDTGLEEKIKELSKERDNGNWLYLEGEKTREEVWNYYEACSVFCLPSYTEGFPNVILEAMSFACPIVATKVGAIPEMLSDGCGEIIEPKTVEPLIDSLNKLLDAPKVANLMGTKAHAKVMANYTIDRVFNMYKTIWKNI